MIMMISIIKARLAKGHQVHMMQVSFLQTGFFRASQVQSAAAAAAAAAAVSTSAAASPCPVAILNSLVASADQRVWTFHAFPHLLSLKFPVTVCLL